MIWRKIKITAEEKQSTEWPYSPEEIIEMLDKGPLREIYRDIPVHATIDNNDGVLETLTGKTTVHMTLFSTYLRRFFLKPF